MKKLDKGILAIHIISSFLSLFIMLVGYNVNLYVVPLITMVAIFLYWDRDGGSTVKQLLLSGIVSRFTTMLLGAVIGAILGYSLSGAVSEEELTLVIIRVVSFITLLVYPVIASFFYRYFREVTNVFGEVIIKGNNNTVNITTEEKEGN